MKSRTIERWNKAQNLFLVNANKTKNIHSKIDRGKKEMDMNNTGDEKGGTIIETAEILKQNRNKNIMRNARLRNLKT